MVRILLFGGIHVDSPSLTENEFRSFCRSDVQAIFIEDQENDPSSKKTLKAMLFNPTYFFGLFFIAVITSTIQLIIVNEGTGPEFAAAEKVAHERNLPLYRVDLDIWKEMSDMSVRHSLLNWIIFVIVIVLIIFSISGLYFGYIFSALTILTLSFGILIVGSIPFVIFTFSNRNHQMLQNVQNISKNNNYDYVCLVVGKSHIKPIKRLINDYDLIIEDTHSRKLFRESE